MAEGSYAIEEEVVEEEDLYCEAEQAAHEDGQQEFEEGLTGADENEDDHISRMASSSTATASRPPLTVVQNDDDDDNDEGSSYCKVPILDGVGLKATLSNEGVHIFMGEGVPVSQTIEYEFDEDYNRLNACCCMLFNSSPCSLLDPSVLNPCVFLMDVTVAILFLFNLPCYVLSRSMRGTPCLLSSNRIMLPTCAVYHACYILPRGSTLAYPRGLTIGPLTASSWCGFCCDPSPQTILFKRLNCFLCDLFCLCGKMMNGL